MVKFMDILRDIRDRIYPTVLKALDSMREREDCLIKECSEAKKINKVIKDEANLVHSERLLAMEDAEKAKKERLKAENIVKSTKDEELKLKAKIQTIDSMLEDNPYRTVYKKVGDHTEGTQVKKFTLQKYLELIKEAAKKKYAWLTDSGDATKVELKDALWLSKSVLFFKANGTKEANPRIRIEDNDYELRALGKVLPTGWIKQNQKYVIYISEDGTYADISRVSDGEYNVIEDWVDKLFHDTISNEFTFQYMAPDGTVSTKTLKNLLLKEANNNRRWTEMFGTKSVDKGTIDTLIEIDNPHNKMILDGYIFKFKTDRDLEGNLEVKIGTANPIKLFADGTQVKGEDLKWEKYYYCVFNFKENKLETNISKEYDKNRAPRKFATKEELTKELVKKRGLVNGDIITTPTGTYIVELDKDGNLKKTRVLGHEPNRHDDRSKGFKKGDEVIFNGIRYTNRADDKNDALWTTKDKSILHLHSTKPDNDIHTFENGFKPGDEWIADNGKKYKFKNC